MPLPDNVLKNRFITSISPIVAPDASPVELRLLEEYGSVLIARGGAVPPPTILFANSDEVAAFQSGLSIRTETIDGHDLSLQSSAMNALLSGIEEARLAGLELNPRGADSAGRDYGGTVELWASRVMPALEHWTSLGRIAVEDAERIRSLSPDQQVPEVLWLEEQGIYFAKDLSKTILYSVAPPGASQHLSLLAFDVREYDNKEVRAILERNFWYQTVVSDLPHFTFLGVGEDDLAQLGLKCLIHNDRRFWVPDI